MIDEKARRCPFCGSPLRASCLTCRSCGRELTMESIEEKRKFELNQFYKHSDPICDTVDFVKSATVKILCSTSQKGVGGTGFFVEERGKTYLVTNYHVVKLYKEGGVVTVRLPDHLNSRKDDYLTFVVGEDPINDIALLNVPFELPNAIIPLRLADLATLRQGQTVVTVGNPQGIDFDCIQGIVSNVCIKIHEARMSQILCSLNASHGNSGGAVVRNSDREVIGVATAILPPDYMQSHTVCASADAVRQMIYIHEKKINNDGGCSFA